MFVINKRNRWFFLIIVCMGMTGIFGVPYLTRGFYNVFQDAMGFTHSQIGNLMSTYGVLSMILFLPGGWLADSYSIRKLLAYSFVVSALLGGVILINDSYTMLLIVYATFAVTSSMVFFPAMLKFVRLLGTSAEQGTLYGFKESFYGVFGVIVGLIVIRINVVTGSDLAAYRWLVILYSLLCLIAGLLLLLLMKEEKAVSCQEEKKKVDKEVLLNLLKIKELWLVTFSVMSCFIVYCSITYTSPYLVEVFKIPNSLASQLGIFRQYVAPIFMCILFGRLADRRGSSVKVVMQTLILMGICVVLFIQVPVNASMITLAVATMGALTLFSTGVRGIYYAQIDEAGLPVEYTGTVIGILAIVAFSPDAFYYTLMGKIIDYHIELGQVVTGYKIVFGISALFAFIGVGVGMILLREIKMKQTEDGVLCDQGINS